MLELKPLLGSLDLEPLGSLDPEPLGSLDLEPLGSLDPEPLGSLELEPLLGSLDPEPLGSLDPEPLLGSLDLEPLGSLDPKPLLGSLDPIISKIILNKLANKGWKGFLNLSLCSKELFREGQPLRNQYYNNRIKNLQSWLKVPEWLPLPAGWW